MAGAPVVDKGLVRRLWRMEARGYGLSRGVALAFLVVALKNMRHSPKIAIIKMRRIQFWRITNIERKSRH